MIEVGNMETSRLERIAMFLFSQNTLVIRKAITGMNIPHMRGTKNRCPQKTSTPNMRMRVTLRAA